MWRKISACVLSSVCFLSACDKSDNTPPTVSGPPVPVPVPKDEVRPTTQQLATRTSLELKYVPLSLMVPTGWRINSLDARVFLQGPTPTDAGDVVIRIPTARTITDVQETLIESQASDMLSKHPELLGSSVVHDITGAKVIEQLVIRDVMPATEPIADLPQKAATLPSTTQPVQNVQWTFSVCVPAGKFFNVYDLSISMPIDQFKADNAFLRSILETLQYTPSAADLPVK